MTVKQWALIKLAGPFGFIFRPILSAMVGVIVARIYDQGTMVIFKVPWLHGMFDATLSRVDPAVLASLTPEAVGGAVAVLLWGFGMDWVGGYLRAGSKQVQGAINQSPASENVRLDGVILPGGETVKEARMVSYSTLYPEDKARVVRSAILP